MFVCLFVCFGLFCFVVVVVVCLFVGCFLFFCFLGFFFSWDFFFYFQRLRFVSLIHEMSPSSFWFRGMYIISRNRGFMVRFLLWTL